MTDQTPDLFACPTTPAGERHVAPPSLPALSIRQPWAWLICHGGKDIENRDWHTNFRGRFLIHASQGMTRDEYVTTARISDNNGIHLPTFDALQRGGIVGEAEIIGCVTQSPSKWFHGRYGFVLRNARPLPFHPCKGQLGFFRLPAI